MGRPDLPVHRADTNILSTPSGGIWRTDWVFHDDKTRAMGFSGTGDRDISQRLSFQCEFKESPLTGTWGGTYSIINMDTGSIVASYGFSGFDASASIQNGTAEWGSRRGLAGGATVWSHAGIDIYIGGALAREKDTDQDGMPDVFEVTYGLNPDDPGDASADADGDGIANLTEAQSGTRPDLADTDGDGANDHEEILHGYSPADSSSSPLALSATLPNVLEDTDGNGMNDVWEVLFGNSAALAAEDDVDGDGATNREESIAGTNPFQTESRFLLQSLVDGDDIRLRWPGLQHKRYEIQSSDKLNIWNPVTQVDPATDAMAEITFKQALAGDNARVFYRVNAGDRDSDADGLSDWSEAALGTDINDPNSTGSPVQSISGGTLISGDYKTFIEALENAGQSGDAGISRPQAARFLNQATFGATMNDISKVQQLGYAAWIDDQINDAPIYLHEPYIAKIKQDHQEGLQQVPNYARGGFGLPGENATTPFIRAATQADDQLRQRIAFALSQILVVSRQDAALSERPQSLCNFYDIFVRNAFGNYRDILQEVSLHPIMGRYLSHVGNEKANPTINQFPDENYAREVMQLFTIGLWELNPDGSRMLDQQGEPIATYGNREITEFARVFTGLWYADRNWGSGGWDDAHFLNPMQMHADRHDYAEKLLFTDRKLVGRGRIVIPARTPNSANGLQDITDTVTALFDHPNTPPFICRQLIQFLVTANPSPGYVRRVQDVFVNDGKGQRGNLGAVTRAILLDPEARDPRVPMARPEFGKLKEPLLRAMAMARAFDLGRHRDLVWHRTGSFYDAAYQAPLSSPTVFNFFRPDYQAPGPIRDASLASPVFQITDSYSAISFPNFLWETLVNGFEAQPWGSERERFSLDFSAILPLTKEPAALVDRLNLLFCSGSMTLTTRRAIITAIEDIPDTAPGVRAMLAAYLTLMSPEGAILR
ncbi:MAG: DUF1800 family protein [Verrucomicrobiales bacterium]